ncbi:MAG: trigger factor, partial [Subdoligranulum sp.]|nr:trigger factor [Subdoligranulum sp.]
MKLIKSEKQANSLVELQFSVDAETFKAAVDKAFKRECKKYNVPGFRRGKAPRAMIEKMFGADVFHYPAINDLFPEAYEAAVAEAGLQVVGQPVPEVVSESLEEGFVIKAMVPVQPEITLGDYAGLEVTKTVHTVTDADVAGELERMQQRNGRQVTREGAAVMGDTATIDFEGFLGEEAFEGGKGEKYPLELGSGAFIPGFEDQVIGHAAGDEFDVNVKFPEDYQEDLAGKDATFKVKIHEITYKELPELDD